MQKRKCVVACSIKLPFYANYQLSAIRNLLEKYICTVYILCLHCTQHNFTGEFLPDFGPGTVAGHWAAWAGGTSQVNMGQPTRAWTLETPNNQC